MPYSIPGANTLLLGPTGTGKTHSLRTIPEAGIETFIVFTEPGMRTVADISCEDGLHWRYIPPANPSWDVMADGFDKVNRALDLEMLTKQKNWKKSEYRQFIDLVLGMNNFKCDRCDVEFGGVDTWNTDRAIVVDSLSGLSIMAMDMAAGAKPVKAPADWGTAMDGLERFLGRMCTGTQCHFVLTAHLEMERDEVGGGAKLMASTLGKKLAPKVPRDFDDVVLCQKDNLKFTWATTNARVDLKHRNLSPGADLPPSFSGLIESWKAAGGILIPTAKEDANEAIA